MDQQPPMTAMTDMPDPGLVDEFSTALSDAKGITYEDARTYAEPIVRYLQRQYGADKIYIPKTSMRWNASEIIAAIAAGKPMKEIMCTFGISRRTYYRLLSQA
jgi:hypothetical protein